MKVLEVDGIKKNFGKKEVLKGIDFELNESMITALVGPNGSGKSTLLNIISNLLTPDSGKVRIYDIVNTNTKIYEKFSYMIDNTVLYPYLTGLDHLKFISDVHGLPKDRIEECLEILGITGFLNQKVKEYSLGMKQQLLFTMTLIPDHNLLLLDEPFNGLDPTTIIKVREVITDLRNSGKTILLSSHNLAEIDQLTSDILFLKDGKVLRENISDYQRRRYEIKVETNGNPIELPRDEFQMEGNKIIFELGKLNLQEAIDRISKKYEITDIQRQIVGSEERYKELFGRS